MRLFILFTGLLLVACEPSLKVTSDHDGSVDFTAYKTYGLYKGSENNVSSLNLDRIERSVRAQMQAKGFSEEGAKPDILVNTTAIVTNKQDVSANTNYYGYGGAMRPYYWNGAGGSSHTSFDVEHYKEGSLIIDIVDNKTGKLIWQGVGNSRLDESSKDADKRISEAIQKIMESFPPKPGGNK